MNGISIQQILAIFSGEGMGPEAQGESPDGSPFAILLEHIENRHVLLAGASADTAPLPAPSAVEDPAAPRPAVILSEIFENQEHEHEQENTPLDPRDVVEAILGSPCSERIDPVYSPHQEQSDIQTREKVQNKAHSSPGSRILDILGVGSNARYQEPANLGPPWNMLVHNTGSEDSPDVELAAATLMQRSVKSAQSVQYLYSEPGETGPSIENSASLKMPISSVPFVASVDSAREPAGNEMEGNAEVENLHPGVGAGPDENARTISLPLISEEGEPAAPEQTTMLARQGNKEGGATEAQNLKSTGEFRSLLVNNMKDTNVPNNPEHPGRVISRPDQRAQWTSPATQVSEAGQNDPKLSAGVLRLASALSLNGEGIQNFTGDNNKSNDLLQDGHAVKEPYLLENAPEPLSIPGSQVKTIDAVSRAQNPAAERAVIAVAQDGIRSILRKGDNRMEIQLHPPSLGRLRIEISVNAHQVSATIIADNHMVKEILETNASQLRDALQEHGLRMGGFQVHVNAQAKHEGNQYYGSDYRQESALSDDGYRADEDSTQKRRFWRADGLSIFV